LVWLDQLAASPDSDGYEEERARYWRARALLEPVEGESELASAAAREVARTDLAWLVEGRPLTYYGLLAHGRFAELDPERTQAIEQSQDRLVQTPAPRTLHAGALGRDPHLLAAIELPPPDLLQALMREESALDPRALSPTGALGLTQVMPSTARMLARKLRLQGYQTARLLEPDMNIRIGGTYLGELYARFQHPALALASYHA